MLSLDLLLLNLGQHMQVELAAMAGGQTCPDGGVAGLPSRLPPSASSYRSAPSVALGHCFSPKSSAAMARTISPYTASLSAPRLCDHSPASSFPWIQMHPP